MAAISPLTLQNHLRTLEGPGMTIPTTIMPAPPIPGQEGVQTEQSFGSILKDSIGKVNQQMVESDQKAQALASGKSSDVHGTMISMEKADISFRTVLEVRSRVLRAYEEIMRIQV